jgi:hypothetical protein
VRMPMFSATASLDVARPYPVSRTKRRDDDAIYPQRLSRRGAASTLASDLDMAAESGGASCTCPCCIISGGILWCC